MSPSAWAQHLLLRELLPGASYFNAVNAAHAFDLRHTDIGIRRKVPSRATPEDTWEEGLTHTGISVECKLCVEELVCPFVACKIHLH